MVKLRLDWIQCNVWLWLFFYWCYWCQHWLIDGKPPFLVLMKCKRTCDTSNTYVCPSLQQWMTSFAFVMVRRSIPETNIEICWTSTTIPATVEWYLWTWPSLNINLIIFSKKTCIKQMPNKLRENDNNLNSIWLCKTNGMNSIQWIVFNLFGIAEWNVLSWNHKKKSFANDFSLIQV